MSYQLGIDLGTTFTAAAVWRPGRAGSLAAEPVTLGTSAATVPSVLYLGADGSIVVGEAAERRALTEPDRVVREFKRRIGDDTPFVLGGREYRAHELAALLVRWVSDRVSERSGAPPAGITVTHPATWGRHKQELLGQALERIGRRVSFLAEPQAAALSYASAERVAPGSTIAVYDLGGGTFDAAVVRKNGTFTLLGEPEGIERLGGLDFDDLIFTAIRRKVGEEFWDDLDPADPAVVTAVAQLRRECVEAKIALSTDDEVTIPVLLPELRGQVKLTRDQFEGMIRGPLDSTVAALRQTIRSSGLTAPDLSAVLLVGGSSRIPLVAELVTSGIGRPVALDVDPQLAIAMGAAISADGARGEPVDVPAPAHPPAAAPVVPQYGPPPAEGPAPPPRPEGVPAAPSPGEPAHPGRGRGRTVLVGVALVVVIAAAVAVGVIFFRERVVGGTPGAGTPPALAATIKVGGMPDGIAVTPDGSRVYVTDANTGQVSVIDAATNTVGATFALAQPVGVAISPDGVRGYIVNLSANTVSVINLADNAVIKAIPVGNRPVRIAITRDGSRVYVTNQGAGTVSVIDAGTDNVIETIRVEKNPDHPTITPDQKLMYVTSPTSNVISIVDLTTNKLVTSLPVPGNPFTVAFNPEGTRRYVTNSGAGTISVVDNSNNAIVKEIPVGKSPVRVVSTPDGRYVYVTSVADSTVSVVDAAAVAVVATIPVEKSPSDAAVSPDGRRVYLTSFGTGVVSVISGGP